MKKAELVHLHGFLKEVRLYYEEETGESVESKDYLDLGVQPTSIHKSKTDHKASIFTLASGITQEMEEPGSTSYDFENYYEELAEEAVNTGVEFDTDPTSSEQEVSFDSYHVISDQEVDLNPMILEELDRSEECEMTYHSRSGRITVPENIVEEYLEEPEARPVGI